MTPRGNNGRANAFGGTVNLLTTYQKALKGCTKKESSGRESIVAPTARTPMTATRVHKPSSPNSSIRPACHPTNIAFAGTSATHQEGRTSDRTRASPTQTTRLFRPFLSQRKTGKRRGTRPGLDGQRGGGRQSHVLCIPTRTPAVRDRNPATDSSDSDLQPQRRK